MKTGDAVFQNYGGLHRYGKVKEIKANLKGEGWTWAKIEWVGDEKFITSQRWKAKMRNKDKNAFIPEYYRADDVHKIDLDKTIRALLKLRELI